MPQWQVSTGGGQHHAPNGARSSSLRSEQRHFGSRQLRRIQIHPIKDKSARA
jgi:hypothetical protein